MRRSTLALFAVGFLSAAGCGGSVAQPPSYGSDDGKAIAVLVDQVNEFKSTASHFEKLFAPGAAPKGAAGKKYATLSYDVSGNPTVSGATATARVKMRKEMGDGGDAGEQEWSFVKDGDKWKIKSAPLP